jgi:hypothetical protein
VDADGDVVMALGHQADGTEYLMPLTPCCLATATGSSDADLASCLMCRVCYDEIDDKYSWHSTVVIKVAGP